jgi:hypothetical protein
VISSSCYMMSKGDYRNNGFRRSGRNWSWTNLSSPIILALAWRYWPVHWFPKEINVPAEIRSSYPFSIIRNVAYDPTFWAEHYVVSRTPFRLRRSSKLKKKHGVSESGSSSVFRYESARPGKPVRVIKARNKTKLMHYLATVYWVTIRWHGSGCLVAHHLEVTMYSTYATVGTWRTKRTNCRICTLLPPDDGLTASPKHIDV